MRDPESTRVHDTELSQPVSVALQLCLVGLLDSWNITPSTVASHSSGEIAAAYVVGLLSFKEALGVPFYRSNPALKYRKSLSKAAAGLSSEKAEEYLKNLMVALSSLLVLIARTALLSPVTCQPSTK